MANKQKKKRNKAYRGPDAAVARPVITKVTAVNRSWLGQWWYDHKRVARPVLIAVAVIVVITWLIVELVRIASNA